MHNHFDLDLSLWIDSLSTVKMGLFLPTHLRVPAGWENQDLWHAVLPLLQDRVHLQTHWNWVPSHVPACASEHACEDWLIHWNDEADRAALTSNDDRPHALWQRFHTCWIGGLLDLSNCAVSIS